MYTDIYDYPTSYSRGFAGIDSTWMIISLVLAIVGGIAAYIVFVSKENNGEYSGFLASLHDFLNFKKFYVKDILKTLYIVTTIFITLSSFSYISSSITLFFMTLILGNIVARISYEIILMTITIVDNVTEINQKMSKNTDNTKNINKPKKKIVKEESEEK